MTDPDDKVRMALIDAIAANCIDSGSSDKEPIQSMIDGCNSRYPFTLTAQDIEAGIEEAIEKSNHVKLLYTQPTICLGILHQLGQVVLEDLASINADSSQLASTVDSIYKAFNQMRHIHRDLDQLLQAHNTASQLSDTALSQADHCVEEVVAKFMAKRPWLEHQPGITNPSTDDDGITSSKSPRGVDEIEENNPAVFNAYLQCNDAEEQTPPGNENEETTLPDQNITNGSIPSSSRPVRAAAEKGRLEMDRRRKEGLEAAKAIGLISRRYAAPDQQHPAQSSSTNTDTDTTTPVSQPDNDAPRAKLESAIESESKIYADIEDRFSVGLIAANTNLLNLTLRQLEDALSNCDLTGFFRVLSITNELITILQPLSKLRQMVAHKAAKTELATIVVINEDSTWGSIASTCEDSQEIELPEEVESFLSDAKEAISLVSQLSVKEFATFGNITSNFLANNINLCIAICVCCNLTLSQVFSNLRSADATRELLRRADELAIIVQPDSPHDPDVAFVLTYISEILCPALRREDCRERALIVACDLRKYLTETSGRKRKEIIIPVYTTAQAYRADGEKDYDVEDYCGGDDKLFTGRRSRIMTLLFNIILKDTIENYLPADLFRQEYMQVLLFNAPSKVKDYCNFNKKFFAEVHSDSSSVVNKLKNNIALSFDDSAGARTLLIEREEQIHCLSNLAMLDEDLEHEN